MAPGASQSAEVQDVVSVREDAGQRRIILRPNRSADWRQNQLLWGFLFLHSALIAIGFALAGAWMILPFMGLEVFLLGAALWYVNWKCSHQQVITLDDDILAIDKGVLLPRRRWRFVAGETSVSVLDAPYPDVHLLAELLARLRACGLRVRRQGAAGSRRF